jgi:hypothetical protein
MFQPTILTTKLGIHTKAEAKEQEKTVMFVVGESQPFEYL